MAIAYLNHTPIGKATQAQPYTAAAHLRYITRKQATNYVYSERMPVQYHAAQRFLTQREDTIRKNGRVCDKFIIALPREMSMEQGIDALRDFGWRLSEGKAPFLFSIQDFNGDNPHAHFLYVDASIEDGSRVFKTTDRDSTERIKRVWADTCNEHLLELGREERIEFGKSEEVANDNHYGDATDKVSERSPDHSEDVLELVSESSPAPACPETPVEPQEPEDLPLPDEEEEFDVDKAVVESGAVTRSERIKAALDAHTEREMLRAEREELERLQEAVARAERAAMDKHVDYNISSYNQSMVGMHDLDPARKALERAPKGFELFGWKSPARRSHEKAQSDYEAAQFRMKMAAEKTAEDNLAAGIAFREAQELDQRRHALEFHLRTRGTTEELITADRIFENTVAANMEGVTVEDVINELEAGSLSADEAKQTLQMMGKESSWDLYEEMNGIDDGIEL